MVLRPQGIGNNAIRATIWDTIDWDALAMAYKEVPIAKHHWALKWKSGHFSHGKNMAQWQFWLLAVSLHVKISSM